MAMCGQKNSEEMGMDKIISKKKWFEKKQVWITIGIVIAILILYISIFANSNRTITVKKDNVEIATVSNGTFQDYISVNGKVEPIRTIYLDAEEGGRVEELFIEEGVNVKKGQPLMKLSNSDLNLQIMNSEASMAEQTTRMRDTRLAMEQQNIALKNQIIDLKFNIQKQRRQNDANTALYGRGIISKEDYLASNELLEQMQEKYKLLQMQNKRDSMSRTIQLKQLDESLELMHNNLKMVRQKLDNLLLRAPVDGQLATFNAEIGENKQRGQRLGIINILTAYKIRADIDEHYIDKVKTGLEARFERNGKTYMLVVSKVYPDVKSGTFGVDLKFTGIVPENIRTGQSFQLTIELGSPGNAKIIPRGGFYQETGGQWIFVLDSEKKTASKRNIKIGRQNPELYEILEGLKDGESVIVSSYTNYEKAEQLIIQ
jgi:HlyD family secretion protein